MARQGYARGVDELNDHCEGYGIGYDDAVARGYQAGDGLRHGHSAALGVGDVCAGMFQRDSSPQESCG